jgi:kynurenine 3-monooxygenase
MRHVLIVGAGLAGCLLAQQLAAAGWRVTVRERRGDPRAQGYSGGRSINLAISVRGLTALRRAGLEAEILKDAIRMPGRMIHPGSGGDPIFQPYSHDPSRAIHSVSRGALNLALLKAADAHEFVSVAFGRRCTDIDFSAPAATFADADGRTEVIPADLIVGADGAYSAVRGAMQRNDRLDYSQSYLGHGYKELHIPAVSSGAHAPWAMRPDALHIWPRGGSMMIALPNPDGSFTCTLFWPWEGEHSFAAVPHGNAALGHFARHYRDALPLMPTLESDFDRNPVSSLVTIRTSPWQVGGNVALIGDAAHAIVPFYGQGANASFEDVTALVDALKAHGKDTASALKAYQLQRIPNANAIADMALHNFIEMRDRTASRLFRTKKRIEHALHEALGDRFIPLYDLVSFTNVPYAQAQARGRRQDRMLLAGAIGASAAAVGSLAGAALWLALR